MRALLLTGFMILAISSAIGQHVFRMGLLPSVNLGVGLKNNWKLNFKAESRQGLLRVSDGRSEGLDYDYILTDLSVIPSRKIGLNNSVAAGYLLRIRDGKASHRLVQQFTIVSKYEAFRLAHRFAADQTFRQGEEPAFRFRYRLMAEFPLNGSSIDVKEFYLKLGNEYLFEWRKPDQALEIRIIPLLGYEISEKNKLEAGFDYRIAILFDSRSAGALWFTINWFSAI